MAPRKTSRTSKSAAPIAASTGRLMALLNEPGPSGYEQRAARVWRAQAEEFADVVDVDNFGNSYAVVNPAGGVKDDTPTVLLAAHIDEIGLIVRRISDTGFLHCSEIGGWDVQVLIGQRVTILGRNGDVSGVIGQVPVHMMDEEAEGSALVMEHMWVDIGARDKEEAERKVRVGDPMVLASGPLLMGEDYIASRCLDNRVGCSVTLEALRQYAKKRGVARVVAVANTQEEIAQSGGGALVASETMHPTVAVVVDLMSAIDQPIHVSVDHRTDCSLGDGPFLARGGASSPVVFDRMEAAAERLGIDYGLLALGGDSSTDMEAVSLARQGIPTTLLSIPSRYMHSPSETASLVDINNTVRLLTAFCQSIKAGMDWKVR